MIENIKENMVKHNIFSAQCFHSVHVLFVNLQLPIIVRTLYGVQAHPAKFWIIPCKRTIVNLDSVCIVCDCIVALSAELSKY